jgi:hypothetical protein
MGDFGTSGGPRASRGPGRGWVGPRGAERGPGGEPREGEPRTRRVGQLEGAGSRCGTRGGPNRGGPDRESGEPLGRGDAIRGREAQAGGGALALPSPPGASGAVGVPPEIAHQMLAPIRDLLGDGVDPVERVELELCGSRARVQGRAEEDEVPRLFVLLRSVNEPIRGDATCRRATTRHALFTDTDPLSVGEMESQHQPQAIWTDLNLRRINLWSGDRHEDHLLGCPGSVVSSQEERTAHSRPERDRGES